MESWGFSSSLCRIIRYDVLGVRGDIQPNAIIQQLDASFRLVRLMGLLLLFRFLLG